MELPIKLPELQVTWNEIFNEHIFNMNAAVCPYGFYSGQFLREPTFVIYNGSSQTNAAVIRVTGNNAQVVRVTTDNATILGFGGGILTVPSAARNYRSILFAWELDGTIANVFSTPATAMKYCGTGGGNTVTGLCINYIGALNNVVALNTYSGSVTGGADTNMITAGGHYNYGANAHFNGFDYGPYLQPFFDAGMFIQQNIATQPANGCQLAYGLMGSIVNNANNTDKILGVYSVNISGNDAGNCEHNYIEPGILPIMRISLKEFFKYPGNISYISRLTSRGNGELVGCYTNYSGGYRTSGFILRYPGPVLLPFNAITSGTRVPKTTYCVDSFGHLVCGYLDIYSTNNFRVFRSSEPINFDFDLVLPTPKKYPIPIVKTDTRHFYRSK